MDAQENKRQVIEGYQMYQSGDIGRLLDKYNDDAEWIGPDSDTLPFAGCFRGKAEIAQFFAKLASASEAVSFAPRHFIAEGDMVVAVGDSTWRAISTGRTYDTPWVHVFTMRDGKVVRLETFYDTAPAARAFCPDPASAAASGSALHH